MTIEKILRPIRSYVLRQGRMTASQQDALSTEWSHYGLTLQSSIVPFDWDSIFRRKAPRILEIGFGMGDSLIAMAQAAPECDFIGIEVHSPGVGRCLANARANNLQNLKVFAQDALEVLNACSDASLDKVYLLFPDPWPKKKHHKRRIVQTAFAGLIAQKLKIEGQFHLATDWESYAEHMLMVLDAHPAFCNAFGAGNFAPQRYQRFQTKFETRGQRLGHNIWDLAYTRTLAPTR